jgi:hypothetical protein
MEFNLVEMQTFVRWSGLETIPNIAPCEFRCECCGKIIAPDEFQSYHPMICIDCED